MSDIYISDFEVLSSQGDLSATVKAIKNITINTSRKHITTDIQSIDIPYFLLQKKIKEDQLAIYQGLKSILSNIITKFVAKNGDEILSSTALIIGTTLTDLNIADSIEICVYAKKKPTYTSKKTSIDTYAYQLAKEFGLSELTMTINTACTSTANAILEGTNLINAEIVQAVIVIGIETYSSLISSGFFAMELLTTTVQKPFTSKRDGLALGEGLAGVVLSKKPSRHHLLGGYSNCNSLTITGVSENGGEYVEVMRQALVNAGINAISLTAIKTHATSTPASDLSEMNALKMFKEMPLLSALKPYIGHTLGACGVLELAIFLACIDDGFIPKFPMQQKHDSCNKGIFLLNYFGFGGNNVSLIISSGLNETLY